MSDPVNTKDSRRKLVNLIADWSTSTTNEFLVADQIIAAGWAPVSETAEKCAQIVAAEKREQWDQDKRHIPCAQIVAQRMNVVEAAIRSSFPSPKEN